MLFNCGVGKDSSESLGLQGDPTSPSWRKSTLNIHWKDWCWSWSSNTLATWCRELTPWKRPWCWERLRIGGEGDDRGWDGWMASLTWWTGVWAGSRSWWWAGRPGVLQSMGLQSQHDSDWTEPTLNKNNKADKTRENRKHFNLCCLGRKRDINSRLLLSKYAHPNSRVSRPHIVVSKHHVSINSKKAPWRMSILGRRTGTYKKSLEHPTTWTARTPGASLVVERYRFHLPVQGRGWALEGGMKTLNTAQQLSQCTTAPEPLRSGGRAPQLE